MVAKVEVSERGFNRRFVVTNRQDLTAGQLYDQREAKLPAPTQIYSPLRAELFPEGALASSLQSPGKDRTGRHGRGLSG